jgi:hypothetical protein
MTLELFSPIRSPLHFDQHNAFWIGNQFLIANDGGVYLVDPSSGAFTPLHNGMNVTQFYGGQTSANIAGSSQKYFFGGTQDNGTASFDGNDGRLFWTKRLGGDGIYAALDPLNATRTGGRWYGEGPDGTVQCSSSGAEGEFYLCSGDWQRQEDPPFAAPFKLNQFHCTDNLCPILVFGAQSIWAHTQSSVPALRSWKKIGESKITSDDSFIVSFDFAMSNPAALVAGTADGSVHISSNAFTGISCNRASANTSKFSCDANQRASWTDLRQENTVLPNRPVLSVTFDPSTDAIVYAAVSGFNENTPSTPGHVFQARKQADSWQWENKSGNLPNIPAYSLVINPRNRKQAFLAMELGFFYTDDIEASPPQWFRFQAGLPNTVIWSLTVDRGPAGNPYASTTLTAFTYGRGVFTMPLP